MVCERTGIESADAVIAVSRGVRQDVLDCYPDVKAHRVQVIHNGIDPQIYRPQPSPEPLTRFGIHPTRPLVLFNGLMTRDKVLPLLLAAALNPDRQHQLVPLARR